MVTQRIPRIRVDFQNADEDGRIRLNTAAALDDIRRLTFPLSDGIIVELVDGELKARGFVSHYAVEGFWVASVDWEEIARSGD